MLAIAEDPGTPLLERAKFLAIFANNLDEFYMLRVAGLKRRLQTGLPVSGPDGLTPREQLKRIADRTAELMSRHAACFLDDVGPGLARQQVRFVSWNELEAGSREELRLYFRDQIFPVLTPLAVDPAHPFPYISGLSLNLAVMVRDPDGGPELFARIKVPNNVPRFVSVDAPGRPGIRGDARAWFLPVEELIAAHLDQLFSGMKIIEHHLFRVTRNADVEVDDDRDDDLLQALERELARRRFGPSVRLEVGYTISEDVLARLARELDMDDAHVVRVPGLLDLSRLWQVYEAVDRPDLKDRPFVPATHPRLQFGELAGEGEKQRSFFAHLRDGDVLVHHPYDSFSTSVQRFIEQAAADPNVLAIKQTLYRTSGDSPIVDALIDAARAGKQVVVLVEVKARFDEASNIGWARALEQAGVHVAYGLVGLKTHSKTALVVRRERGGIRRYVHIGTGNYNAKTANLYTDVGLLSCDEELGADLTDLFNSLTGYARGGRYRKLMVAPNGLREQVIGLIERTTERHSPRRPGRIVLQMNSLVDAACIRALYAASQAGVEIDLIVRGICRLRPGVPGVSETIRVRSVVGRFLEHARIWMFANGRRRDYYIGSADLMPRNLDLRVEAVTPVTDPDLTGRLQEALDVMLADNQQAWELSEDGGWQRRQPADGEKPVATHRALCELALRRGVEARAGGKRQQGR